MGKKSVLILVAIMAAVVCAFALGIFVFAPRFAQDAVEERLASFAQKTGLTITTEGVEPMGLRGVRMLGLEVFDEQTSVLRVETIEAEASVIDLAKGQKSLSSLTVSGVKLNLELNESGSPVLLQRLKSKDSEPSTESESSSKNPIVRRLEQVPNLEALDVEVTFISPDPDFPIQRLSVPKSGWSWDGESLEATAKLELDESKDPKNLSLPRVVDIAVTLNSDLVPTGGGVTLDQALRVSGIGPLPFLQVGLSGVEFTPEGGIKLMRPSLKLDERDIASVESAEVRVNSIADIRSLSIAELILDAPVLFLDYDKTGSGPLVLLDEVVRQPKARSIVGSARAFANQLAKKKKNPEAEPEPEEEDLAPPEEEIEAEATLPDWVEKVPKVIRITNAAIKGTDLRGLPLENAETEFSLTQGNFELLNKIEDGDFEVRGGFKAQSGMVPRGAVDIDIVAKILQRSVQGEIEVDALDLSWLGQILGPRLAKHVRGGILRSKIEFKPLDKPQSFAVQGLVSVEDLAFHHAMIAEEVVDDVDASYSFDAVFDAGSALPAPRLAQVPVYRDETLSDGTKKPSTNPTPTGGLVFRSGKFTFNGVSGTLRPSFHGFNAPGRWPARFDVAVELPETKLQTLIDAVPKAIQGPVWGTKLGGTFKWKFELEVPMYRASDMVWKADPVLTDVQLLSVPEAVDPRRLLEPMTLTIVDSIKEEDDFTRTIRTGPLYPTPADWLMEHAQLTLEQIDERARRRGWPEVSTPERSGLRRDILESPQYWLTPYALSKKAPKPWSDDEVIERTPERPYGRYVYVPLIYISPYLPKAVMTTEDSSFFTNDGFNTHALKASVEQNLSHGGFKRGASTIAMQMVKNVFLDRKKLIVRKLREAFIVFLMESVVDVPKERIMEIYLNVIEFGPGIFGIHEASLHYFGKRPDELTLGEVAWFVSIIPGPKKWHFYWERGEITPHYFNRMKRYMQVMLNRERITPEELEAAIQAPPEFYKPTLDEPVLKPKEPEFPIFAPFDPALYQNPQENSPPPTTEPMIPRPLDP